jgi:hypothetical protein
MLSDQKRKSNQPDLPIYSIGARPRPGWRWQDRMEISGRIDKAASQYQDIMDKSSSMAQHKAE